TRRCRCCVRWPRPVRTSRGDSMGKLLEGLKVIDCGSFIAAPTAATLLGDLGADVIKVEPPGAGDPCRVLPKLPGMPKSAQPYGWLLDNRNKRGPAPALTKTAG